MITGENFIEEILEMINTPFSKYHQLSVYPYPVKYFNEWKKFPEAKDKINLLKEEAKFKKEEV